jgi:hypothetical protein
MKTWQYFIEEGQACHKIGFINREMVRPFIFDK